MSFSNMLDSLKAIFGIRPITGGNITNIPVSPMTNQPSAASALPSGGTVPYYIFYDDETANSRSQQICQIGYVVTDQWGRILVPPVCQLIQPQCNFDKVCMSVHGITPQDVQWSPTLWQYCQSSHLIWLLSNCVFVAHNAKAADLTHLRKSFAAANIPMPEVRFVDTMRMAKELGFQKTGLSDVCRVCQVPLDAHHNALDDAMACYRIFGKMVQMGAMTQPELWSPNQKKTKASVKPSTSKKKSTQKKAKTSASSSSVEYYRQRWLNKEVANNTVYGSDRSVDSVLAEFAEHGLLIQVVDVQSLVNTNIVVSGYVGGLSKEQIGRRIEALGGTLKKGMSKRVNLLVIGPGVGPKKIEYALENSVRVISADEFAKVLRQLQPIQLQRAIASQMALRRMRP